MTRWIVILVASVYAASAQPLTLNDSPFSSRSSRFLDKLVMYLRMEEVTGTRYDSMQTNYALAASTTGLPSQTNGRVGYGVWLKSADKDFLLVTNKASIRMENNTAFTVALWFKPFTVSGGSLFSKCSSIQGTNIEYKALLFSGQAYFYVGNGVSFATAGPTASLSISNWHYGVFWHDPVAQKIYAQVDNATPVEAAWTGGTLTNSANLAIGCFNGNFTDFYNGVVDEFAIWKRVLTAAERTQLFRAVTFPRFGPVASRSLDSPQPYQIFQRVGTVGDILVSGNVGQDGTHTIEARFNGGAWQTIQANATSTFSGYITSQPQGQGLVEVRYADIPQNIFPVNPVGIGDLFVVSGQSNASGHGQHLQVCSNGTSFVSCFFNRYAWGPIQDPVDSNVLQVDYISADTNTPGQTWGSAWPLLGTFISTNQNVPVGFIPCPLGGTDLGAWQPGTVHTNRLTIYGSMVWRGKYAAGGAKAVIWWQGENDANFGTNQSTYFNALTNLAYNVKNDMGCALMPSTLQAIPGTPNVTNINNAIYEAWTNNVASSVIPGAEISGLTADFGSHITTDSGLLSVAQAWWTALKTAFY